MSGRRVRRRCLGAWKGFEKLLQVHIIHYYVMLRMVTCAANLYLCSRAALVFVDGARITTHALHAITMTVLLRTYHVATTMYRRNTAFVQLRNGCDAKMRKPARSDGPSAAPYAVEAANGPTDLPPPPPTQSVELRNVPDDLRHGDDV